jgi:hypothetical protein
MLRGGPEGPVARTEEVGMKRYVGRIVLLVGLAVMPLGATGCISDLLGFGGIVEFFLRGIGVGGGLTTTSVSAAPAKTPRIKESIPVQVTASIGGLAGTFDVTVGGYGSLTGVADIKGQKKAVLKVQDDAQMAALIEAMVLDVAGVQVEVTTSKTKFKGKQTTGGVKKKYKCRIAWKGTVVGGPAAGMAVSGRLKTKGTLG